MEQNKKIYKFAASELEETFKRFLCGNHFKTDNLFDEFYIVRIFVQERLSEWRQIASLCKCTGVKYLHISMWAKKQP